MLNMPLLPLTPLDNSLVSILLSKGEMEVDELQRVLAAEGQPVTIQGVYKGLRRLIHNDIVVKNKQAVAISSEWAEGLLEQLENALHPLQLKSGESVAYSFRRLSSLDAQWKHVMAPLERSLPDYPVFLYNPYEIWIELPDRRASEERYFDQFAIDRRYCFCLLGKDNPHNDRFKQARQSDFLQVAVGNEAFSDREHIAIIADYIITTILPPRIARELNEIFKNPDETCLAEKVSAIFAGSTALKLKIERNGAKAKILRRKMAKDFYVPKELKEKYTLF